MKRKICLLIIITFIFVSTFGNLGTVNAAADTITIDRNTTYQTMWGFGASATWPAQELMADCSPAVQKAVLDKLFNNDNDNAGLSMVRLEINSYYKDQKPPVEDPRVGVQVTCEPSDGVWDWNTDYHQRWFAQEAINRGVKDFTVVPWSAPGWMKTTNSCVQGNLRTDMYDKFALYLKTYVDHYRNVFNIPIKSISVQNEPDIQPGYASCGYDNNSMSTVMAKVADAVHSLDQGVLVGAPEGTGRSVNAGYLNTIQTQGNLAKLDWIPTHEYGPYADLRQYGKTIYNTEYSDYQNNNDPSMTDAFKYCNYLTGALDRGEPGWMFWWCIQPSVKGTGEALAYIYPKTQTYAFPKRLYMMGQFSRAMRPGDIRVKATSTNANLKVYSSKNSSGKASLVVVNSSNNAVISDINGFSLTNSSLEAYRTSDSESLARLTDIPLSSGVAGNVTFPAKSITTLMEKGSPILPGQIEAENFSAMNGIQTETCTDVGGGNDVTGFTAGDWLDYNVNVQTSGLYSIELRMAAQTPTGTLQLQKGATTLATVTPPITGTGQTWQTVKVTANLSAGEQTLRLYSTGANFNLNWVKFSPGLPQVITPVITPDQGIYNTEQTVTISCDTIGSTIRYTTDGSNPNENSTVYSAPIDLAASATLKAYATAPNMFDSSVATATYTLNIKPYYPVPGQVEAENFSDMIGFQTEACTDVGGGLNIGYTDPTDWLDYNVDVQTAGSYTVEFRMSGVNPTGTLQIQKAGAVLATVTPPNTGAWQTWQTVNATVNLTAGKQTLKLVSAGSEFNINWIKFTPNTPQVATPTFTPAAGTYTSAQTVAISCATVGSTIRYTTDGSTPTATSPIYTAPINVAASTTIKAFATATGMTTSTVATAAYTISIKPTYPIPGLIEAENYSAMLGFQTQACTDVGGGLNAGYTDPGDWMDYDVTVQTAGSYTVEFRMAGMAPTGTLQLQKAGVALATITPPNTGGWQTWQTVTATVNLTAGVQTLRLYSNNGSKFNINWFKFTANTPQVATPTFTPAAGTYTSAQTVAIACATAGSTIRYTTDGSTPTATSPVYTAPINVAATTTIKAFATATGMTDSLVVTAAYVIQAPQVATPTFTPAAGTYTSAQTVAIACATAGSTVRYTTDGSTPTATSPVYSAPINVAATTTIKAFATATGMTDSPVATAAYTITIKPTFPIPGQFEAENYSAMLGFQTEACTDVGGGLNVGYTDPGDWMDYDVNVQTAGTYTVELRMAGLVPTGTLQIQKAGAVLATITPPNTGGYQVWQTVTATVNLTAGVQTLRLYSNNGDKFNINWIKFTANIPQVSMPILTPAAGTYTSAQTVAISCATAGSTIRYTTDGSTPTATSPVYTAPINVAATTTIKAFATATGMTDSPIATAAYTINIKPVYLIPGQLEAENYSAMLGFQTEACTDVGGGINVGYTDPTDWLDYDVNVQTAGSYTVEFRMSGVAPTGTLQLQKAGVVLATITPPNTGGWQTWQTVKATVNLTAGQQTLRLYSTGSLFNINWVKFTANTGYNGIAFSDSVYTGGPQVISGRLQNEYYDMMNISSADKKAGAEEGICYHDSDNANSGSGTFNGTGTYNKEFRMNESGDISYTKFNNPGDLIDDSPYNFVMPDPDSLYLGWLEVGEWFNYTVDVKEAGYYSLSVMYTSKNGGHISFDSNGNDVTGQLELPSTFVAADPVDWRQAHHWNKVQNLGNFYLPAGIQVLTLHIVDQPVFNFDYMEFVKVL